MSQIMPDEYISSIHEIDLDKLWARGIRVLLSDLDNTLVPWNDPALPEPLLRWFDHAHAMGFRVCVVSNNRGPRVQEFAERTGIPSVGAAKKPKPDAFLQALKRFDLQPEQAAMIGDQLFTDVRGANALGIYTVLVLPIHPREWWGTRMVRVVERVVMKSLVRRGLRRPL